MKRLTTLLIALAGITVISAAQTGTFRQEGIASWYGNEFDGRPTASGEIFNSSLLTAAHPSLPFGTILNVTNKQNNRQVTVRVNDRGPFVSARIVDLSRAAAEVLDMIITGTAPVILEQKAAPAAPVTGNTAAPSPVQSNPEPVQVNRPETAHSLSGSAEEPVTAEPARTASAVEFSVPPAAIKGTIPQAGSTKTYRIQVGAYKVPRYATDAFDKLRKAGLNPAYEQNGDFYRVVLAGIRAGEIQSIAQTLGNAGFREAIIREEPGR